MTSTSWAIFQNYPKTKAGMAGRSLIQVIVGEGSKEAATRLVRELNTTKGNVSYNMERTQVTIL